jgi:hypothetical protein
VSTSKGVLRHIDHHIAVVQFENGTAAIYHTDNIISMVMDREL